MESSRSFKARLRGKFSVVLLFSFVISLIVGYQLYLREIQNETLSRKIAPDYQNLASFNRQYTSNLSIFEHLEQHSTVSELNTKYQLLIEGIKLNRQLAFNDKSRWQRLSNKIESQLSLVNRLSEPAERNELLRSTAQLQLQLVLDVLRDEITKTQLDIAELFSQIEEDNISDKVTVSRAKAYIRVNQLLQFYQQSYQAFDQFWQTVNTLNLYMSKANFEQSIQNFSSILTLWTDELHSSLSAVDEKSQLIVQVNNLNNLLFIEQNAVAKWRGQLRLAEEFLAQLAVDKNEFKALGDRITTPKISTLAEETFIEKTLKEFAELGVKHPYLSSPVLAVALVSLLFLLFVLSYLLLRREALREVEAFQGVVLSNIQGKPVEKIDLISRETRWMDEQLGSLTAADITPLEHKAVVEKFENIVRIQQQNLSLFTFDNRVTTTELYQFVESLQESPLGELSTWRSVFNRQSLKDVLAFVKSEKKRVLTQSESEKENCLQTSLLLTTGKALDIVIVFQQVEWVGFIYVNKEAAEKSSELAEIKQRFETRLEELISAKEANIDSLKIALERLSIQNQQKDNTAESIVSRFQQKASHLYRWCEHQLAIMPTSKNFTPVPGKFNLAQLLSAIVENKMAQFGRQKHRMFVTLAPEVKQDVNGLYHELKEAITLLIDAVLEEHIQSVLGIYVSVQEENPEQQQLLINFTCQTKAPKENLPARLQALTLETGSPGFKGFSDENLYWHHLQTPLKITDVSVSLVDFGFGLSFSLPLVSDQSSHLNTLPSVNKSGVLLGVNGLFNRHMSKLAAALNISLEIVSNIEKYADVGAFSELAESKGFILIDVGSNKRLREEFGRVLAETGNANSVLLYPFESREMLQQSGAVSSNYGVFTSEHFYSLVEQNQRIDIVSSLMPEQLDTASIPVNPIPKLLFACPEVERYIGQINILRQFGVNVTLVTNPHEMMSLWTTGRFSLLATAFAESPFSPLNVGRQVVRGVILLNEELQRMQKPKDFAHWKLITIENWTSLDSVYKSLNDWLPEASDLKQSQQDKQHDFCQPSEKVTLDKENANDEKSLCSDLGVHEENQTVKLTSQQTAEQGTSVTVLHDSDVDYDVDYDDNVFDLVTYTNHQGSPELAVLMLDEYLTEIDQHMEALALYVADKDYSEIARLVSALQDITVILGAKDFTKQLKRFSKSVEQQNVTAVDQSFVHLVEQHQCFMSISMAL